MAKSNASTIVGDQGVLANGAIPYWVALINPNNGKWQKGSCLYQRHGLDKVAVIRSEVQRRGSANLKGQAKAGIPIWP